ncbi:MAG: hypothetical protein K0R55_968 [Sporomusa sp.]|jgi:hypothetical protein|nr:hypothetical protein [Sporomusa sp.]
MTTDFLVDVKNEGNTQLIAICVKPSQKLKETRIREKLEIEQFYWRELGIPWKIVTEKEIPVDLVKNLQWLYSTRNWYDQKPPFSPELSCFIEGPLLEELSDENRPLSISALIVDKRLELKPGTCLDIFRYLVAIGYWKVDMLSFIDTAKSIKVTRNIDITCEGCEANASYNCGQLHY